MSFFNLFRKKKVLSEFFVDLSIGKVYYKKLTNKIVNSVEILSNNNLRIDSGEVHLSDELPITITIETKNETYTEGDTVYLKKILEKPCEDDEYNYYNIGIVVDCEICDTSCVKVKTNNQLLSLIEAGDKITVNRILED